MGVYTEAYYHFVWATRRREWFITEAVERDLHRFIHGKCEALRVHIYALSGMPDHVHLVVGLPATLSVSDFTEQIKGTSSHYINHLSGQPNCLYWQPGYGLLTFAQNDLARVVAYVENQKQHHAIGGHLSPKMERTTDWEAKSQPHEVGVPGVRAQYPNKTLAVCFSTWFLNLIAHNRTDRKMGISKQDRIANKRQ